MGEAISYFKVLVFFFFFLLTQVSHSQQLSWEWSINPSSFADSYRRIHQINDSIFQISGYIGNPVIMNLTRINPNGDTISYLNLTGLPNNYFILDHYSWQDNGFIVTGESDNARSWLAGLDSTGNIVWQHFLNTNAGFSEITRIRPLNDGGYLFIGHRVTDANQYYADILTGRLDSLGNILWEKYFPILFNQTAHDFVEMPDGSFFISGYSETVALGATPYIMQIDIKGNLIAEHYPQINGFANMNIGFSKIALKHNGHTIISGHDSNPPLSRNAFIAELNDSLLTSWDTLIFKAAGFNPKVLIDGSLIAHGFTVDSGTVLLKFNPVGNKIISFVYPNNSQKFFSDVCLSHDGFMIGVGNEKETNPNFTELYAARYDSVGEAFVPDYCKWNLPEATFYYDYQAPILTLYDSSFSGLQYHDSIYQFQWYTSQGDTSFGDSLLTLFDTSGNNTLDVTLIVSNWHGCRDTLTKTLDFQPSGTLNTINDLSIRMYPNPAASLLRFEIQDNRIESFSIRVLDLNGKGLLQKECKSSTFEMDISKLSSGIYITEISTNTETIRKKLIKK